MKFQNAKQYMIAGGVSSLALLFLMGPVNAGVQPEGDNNKGGASIGVSATCVLVQDVETGKPLLRVTPTAVNKSSGDASPDFTENGSTVRAKEKGSGKGEKYEQVGATAIFTAALGSMDIDINLCDDFGNYLGPDNTVSLNASISINVDNDNKGEYASRCKDDPETELDEGKVVISAAELNALCMNP